MCLIPYGPVNGPKEFGGVPSYIIRWRGHALFPLGMFADVLFMFWEDWFDRSLRFFEGVAKILENWVNKMAGWLLSFKEATSRCISVRIQRTEGANSKERLEEGRLMLR